MNSPFAGDFSVIQNALIIPANSETKTPRQVFDVDNNRLAYLDTSYCDTPVRDIPDVAPSQVLKGTYVFGGFSRAHFGHFMVECIAPLWVLDNMDHCDGIIFLPFHGNPNESERNITVLQTRTQTWTTALQINEPVHILRQPTRVETLYVGENGFGFDDRFSGSPQFQRFVRTRTKAATTPPEKSSKIYITRSQMRSVKGHVIGETALEKTFADAGYKIFAPEKYPLEEQLNTYRTATHIVGVEGSAMHLPPFTCAPTTKIAVISRRSSVDQINREFGAQFRGFAGIDPVILDTKCAGWDARQKESLSLQSLTIIDFDATYAALCENGFLDAQDKRYLPTSIDICHQIFAAQQGHKTPLFFFELPQS